MWIPRDIEPRLQRSARTRPVVVLTGARQTGKTSTLLRFFPTYGFVSLDLPSEAEQAEKEPQNFLGRHPPPTLISEVHPDEKCFRIASGARGYPGIGDAFVSGNSPSVVPNISRSGHCSRRFSR